MFGLVSKKKVLNKMKTIKDSNRKEDLYYKSAETVEQATRNVYSQGYEDGTDNLYNAMKSFLK